MINVIENTKNINILWLLSDQVCLRSNLISLDRDDIVSCHATSSCVTASAHSSNFDLRSYDLAEIDTDGTFVFLFSGLSSKKPVQEKRGRTKDVWRASCILYYTTIESRRKPHCLPRGPRFHRNLEYLWRSLRRTRSSTGKCRGSSEFRVRLKGAAERNSVLLESWIWGPYTTIYHSLENLSRTILWSLLIQDTSAWENVDLKIRKEYILHFEKNSEYLNLDIWRWKSQSCLGKYKF